ncbi:hypothetical protein BKA56DRAFT_596035 [Ilyonectria sp. MPI-CAGE-AT-0026]|nr:hypothetical protein BKA56DRAFT_596035 [Ilyonectria sp. MPI-CAGE-AT-0026]
MGRYNREGVQQSTESTRNSRANPRIRLHTYPKTFYSRDPQSYQQCRPRHFLFDVIHGRFVLATVGVAMHAPRHGNSVVHTIVGVHVLPVEQGELFPTVHGVRDTGVGVAMHAPPQGTPLVQVMVGVQVLPFEHGELLPTVQIVDDAGVGVAMHSPPHGKPGVECIVGVQVLPAGQEELLPIIQGLTGGGVGSGLMQRPPQGVLQTQVCVGVQVQEIGQGALLPTVQEIVYCGRGVGVQAWEGMGKRGMRARSMHRYMVERGDAASVIMLIWRGIND